MEQTKNITGKDAEDVWQQINADFARGVDLHDYHVAINQGDKKISLDITSSPGGSEEGGYDVTTLTAELPSHTNFRFDIHPEDFLNRIGKMLGSQDVIIGYPEFDKNVIVKTNDEQKFKKIFANSELREVFQSLSGFSFKIDPHEEKHGDYLQLYIQRAITSSAHLHKILRVFSYVLENIA